MDPAVSSAAMKLLLPMAGVALMLLVARKRALSWRDDLGLRAPHSWQVAAGWLAGWVALVALEEALGPWLGLDSGKRWAQAGTLALVLRVLAIGVAGPLAEEFAFRGVVLGGLRKHWERHLPWLVVLVALAWALLHVQYAWATVATIFLDGLVLGAARVHTRSLWVPVLMHVGGNLFSVGQSLGQW